MAHLLSSPLQGCIDPGHGRERGARGRTRSEGCMPTAPRLSGESLGLRTGCRAGGGSVCLCPPGPFEGSEGSVTTCQKVGNHGPHGS